jgi:hypothetical protein
MGRLPGRGLWVVGPVRNPQASQREVRVAPRLAQHSNVSTNLMDAASAIRHIFFTRESRPVLRLYGLCLASSLVILAPSSPRPQGPREGGGLP